jgi:hypothetical protein
MKHVAIETEKRPIADWLPRGDRDEVVYLTRRGKTKFVVVPWDESDEEVRAIRSNNRLMARIDDYIERARRGPTKSLEEIKKKLGLSRKRRTK